MSSLFMPNSSPVPPLSLSRPVTNVDKHHHYNSSVSKLQTKPSNYKSKLTVNLLTPTNKYGYQNGTSSFHINLHASASRMINMARPVKTPEQLFREQERSRLNSEKQFRYRIIGDDNVYTVATPVLPTPPPASPIQYDPCWILDPKSTSPTTISRPKSSRSIPSRSRLYVLQVPPRIQPTIIPTLLERQLIEQRFPQHKDKWLANVNRLKSGVYHKRIKTASTPLYSPSIFS